MKLLKKTGRSMAVPVMLSVILLGACSEEETPKEETPKEGTVQEDTVQEETPKESIATGEQLANIINYELSTRTLTLDEVEWIEESDTDRIKELELDVEKDLPTGFVVYNETNEEASIKLAEDAEIYLVNQENPSEPREVDDKEFISYLVGVKGPYTITVEDDEVVKVEEKYMP